MRARNPYLVTKALKNFMWGSILAAVSSQLATTIDAIVVSNLIGPDAISAINLMMPILTLFTCLMILFGIGASIVAAKAIGRRDEDESNGVFTSSIMGAFVSGLALALIIFIFSAEIVKALTGGNEQIYPLALSYLRVMCVAVPLQMMAGVVENFVKTDGNPNIVMIAVIAGSIVNLILDIVFVKFLGMGIAGSAWATGINYLVAILICLVHFRGSHCSLKWRPDKKRMHSYISRSVSQGMPISINTFLLAGCILGINYIVLGADGADGIYCWSVCLQLFLIMQMVFMGIGSSIYAIGGLLVGEQDMEGLAILNYKTIVYTSAALAVVTAVILIFPEFFGRLFGSRTDNPITILPMALRAYVLMLIPYSIVALLRTTYQILGHVKMSLFLSVFQLLIMLGFVWGFSFISSGMLWWGFPASAVALLTGIIIYTFYVHHRNPDLRAVTLIPKREESQALNISVRMDPQSLAEADMEVTRFLKSRNMDDLTTYRVRLSCEELMHNIVYHAVAKNAKKHYFDLHIRTSNDDVNVLIKDDGRPFNPIITDNMKITSDNPDDKIGLKIVNCTAGSINYKYMYDQNMVMLRFPRNK